MAEAPRPCYKMLEEDPQSKLHDEGVPVQSTGIRAAVVLPVDAPEDSAGPASRSPQEIPTQQSGPLLGIMIEARLSCFVEMT